MNPLIEKFWNDAGYKIVHKDPYFVDACFSDGWWHLWMIYKNNIYINNVGKSETFSGSPNRCPNPIKCHFYFFNNKTYSEEEMLKIIGLKAFI